MSAARILLYVQHLLGIGHFVRTARLARALGVAGFDVEIVSGGTPVPGLDIGKARLVQLPPLTIGSGDFHDLRDAGGASVDAVWKRRRCGRLLDAFRSFRPDVLIVEAFPFGRRQMRFELLPLLDAARAARPRPLVLCSVRDILRTGRKPGRAEETVALIEERFDGVLVHGDPRFARLEDTFPKAAEIASKLHYTGIVADPDPLPRADRREGVVVSVGGGSVGRALLETALAARPLTTCAKAHWHLLYGINAQEDAVVAADRQVPEGVTVERHRSDFRALIAGAAVSVSQAGYNTVADLLQAGVPAVLVPFSEGKETEQSLRATRLAERGLAQTVPAVGLDPRSLARAIDDALRMPPRRDPGLDLDGAATSAGIVARFLAARDDTFSRR